MTKPAAIATSAIWLAWIAAALWGVFLGPVHAQHETRYDARVLSVHDGDTITVDRNGQTVHARLAQIDAPELRQPYGPEAKQALCAIVCGQTVTIEDQGTDRYGRTIGLVLLGDRDVNADMVRIGAAWVYRQYAHDPKLEDTERNAREHGLGLWHGLLAPWIYRHGH